METIKHEFPPYYDANSKILILGTIPSVKSREVGFYYCHPQNRFWKVLANLYQEEIPHTIEEKKQFLTHHHIALWDVLASCAIEGSSDQSIRCPICNDLSVILNHSAVEKIYTTGKKAYDLYQKYCYPKTKIDAILLPSTSPANAAYSLEKLVKAYSQIKE